MERFTPPEVQQAAQREQTKSAIRGMLEAGGSLGLALNVGIGAMKELGANLTAEQEAEAKQMLQARLESAKVEDDAMLDAMRRAKGDDLAKERVAKEFLRLVEEVAQESQQQAAA